MSGAVDGRVLRRVSGPSRAGFLGLWTPYALAIPGALILSWFAVYNGYPLIYEDTIAYFQRPAMAIARYVGPSEWSVAAAAPIAPMLDAQASWMAGRSVYYGLMGAVFAALGSVWLVVALQAYVVAAAIAVVCVRTGASIANTLVLFLILAVGTTAPVFVATLLPDIFTAATLLSAATLLCLFPRLAPGDVVFLGLVATYGALTHDSTLLLLAIIVVVTFGIALGRRETARTLTTPAVVLAAACAIGLAGVVVFDVAARAATGMSPLRLPHLSARLATSDVGQRYLEAHCATSRFVVCRYRSRLPGLDWKAFLFTRAPKGGLFATVDAPTKRALADEQIRLSVAVFAYDPAAVIGMVITGSARQLVDVSLGDLHTIGKDAYFQRRLPPTVHDRLAATRSHVAEPVALKTLSRTSGVLSLAGFMIIATTAFLAARRRTLDARHRFLIVLLAVVTLNAIVCASLASPYARFQARVVWLLPFGAAFLFATLPAAARAPRRAAAEMEFAQ